MRDESTPGVSAGDKPLVVARQLTKTFVTQSGLPFLRQRTEMRAVDAVDLTIHRGETLGLVGESGSGKSTLGRVLLNLIPKTSGSVDFDGVDLDSVSPARMRQLRRQMQIVFQDPYSSLHPRMTVRQTIAEGLLAKGLRGGPEAERRIAELAEAVGLTAVHLRAHPHRLSGGQRQRVAIARALSVEPRFIVADEPVSALDVSIQAQILNLFADVQARFGLTYLFISHDLNVIRYLADRVAVMYRGRIVEQAPAAQFFSAPTHPYSRLLLSAMPKSDYPAQHSPEVPVPGTAVGCGFAPRCPLVQDACRARRPELARIAPNHSVACLRGAEILRRPELGRAAPAPAGSIAAQTGAR
jgi:oligopeptide/dipeptide ABC transporter ATP-binding protein